METLKRTEHRGWKIHIYMEGYIAATYENEHGSYKIEEDMSFQDADDCEAHVLWSINYADWVDPDHRSAAFKDIDPDSIPELGYGV